MTQIRRAPAEERPAAHLHANVMLSANQAGWDRVLRLLIGVGMLTVGGFGFVPRPWDFALVLFAVFPLITGASGWCPLYVLFGFRSNRKSSGE